MTKNIIDQLNWFNFITNGKICVINLLFRGLLSVNAIHLEINDGNSDPVIVGQNLTLNCSIYVYPQTQFTKTWSAPGKFDWVSDKLDLFSKLKIFIKIYCSDINLT